MIGSIQCAYEKGKRKIARRMKAGGINVEMISEVSGLTIEDIKKL